MKITSTVLAMVAALMFAAVLPTGCCGDGGEGHLRGSVAESVDGRTYLAIVDDNGGGCGPLTVDGVAWPHAIGQPGPVTPGPHTIACGEGGGLTVVVPEGMVFSFDYWGP